MPDHVHALVTSAEGGDIDRFVRAAKQHSGFAYARRTGARLWQEGYYDHALRSEESERAVIAYIVANPLRAGLVERVEEYPYWGSVKWSRAELLRYVGDSEPRRPSRRP